MSLNYLKRVFRARVQSTKYKLSGFCNVIAWNIKRRRLRNQDFTLIANNCCGGIISHNLGLKFLSPTVNLFIPHKDFLVFLYNLKDALAADIKEIKSNLPYPVGQICLDDEQKILIHFVHYKTFEQAVSKWKERCRRINYDNLYVLMEMGRETSPEYLDSFHNIPFPNKVAITNKEYPDYPESIFIDIYGADYVPGKMVDIIPNSPYRYIDLFDSIKWFNTGKICKSKFYKKYLTTK